MAEKVKYEVIKSAGEQFPVGFQFESDSLHSCMEQHVRRLGVVEQADSDVDERVQDEAAAYIEAAKLNKAIDKKSGTAAAAAAAAALAANKAKGPAEGPGENS